MEVSSPSEARILIVEAVDCLAVIGRCEPLAHAILAAWPKFEIEQRAMICLAMGVRFLPGVLGIEPDRGTVIAADCIANRELHEFLRELGNDPLDQPEVLRLACSKTSGTGENGAAVRRATVRASVLMREPDRDYPAASRSIVDRELVEWVRCFDEHRDQGVLRAVLASTRSCGPRIDAWLSGRHHDEHLPLRSAAAKVDLEIATGLAIGWLAWPALIPAARRVFERVVESREPELVEALLEPWVLLRSRRRAERVGLVLTPKALERLLAVRGLSDQARSGLVELAGCLDAHGPVALVRAGVVADPDPMIRMKAVGVLASAPAAQAIDEGLEDFGYDREPFVARRAVGAIARVKSRHRRVASAERLRGLLRSSCIEVRDAADRALGRIDPLHVPHDEARRWWCPSAARWMLGRSPDTFLDGLRARLAAEEAPGDAIELVRRLGLSAACCDGLIRVARSSSDARVRASAALLMGAVERDGGNDACLDRAFATLADLLGDPDARIRANAVEALSMLRGRTIRLDRFAADDTPRVRANAIRHGASVSQESEDRDDLVSMLEDDRPDHRLSALWVVSRVRPIEVAERIAAIARDDRDALVRQRAKGCAIRLLSVMQPLPREVGVG